MTLYAVRVGAYARPTRAGHALGIHGGAAMEPRLVQEVVEVAEGVSFREAYHDAMTRAGWGEFKADRLGGYRQDGERRPR